MNLIAASVLALVACGAQKSGTDAATCPNDVPAACPVNAPTYVQTVAPILAQRCGACHTAGGADAARSFDTYSRVYTQRGDILSQIHRCAMPPADQPQLTSDERQSVLAWLVCGAQPDGCPDDAPATCPDPAPHFAADASVVFQGHCVKCHAPNGKAARFPLTSYAEIGPLGGDVLLQLQTCAMPPPTETALTATERQTLLGWLVCGALDD